MNDSVDLQQITRVFPVSIRETESEADVRGSWPVLAFTADLRVVVLEHNVN
jgi:hypothetical protein